MLRGPRFRPIYAVLERELLRMFRQRTRLVAAMVRPLIWLLVIGGRSLERLLLPLA